MVRLIDADALIDELIQGAEADKDKSIQATFAKSVCMILCKAIERQPTIDAVPVKHGKWEPITKGEHGYSAGDFRCSVCHQPNKCYCLTKFCPNCGARMDEERKE